MLAYVGEDSTKKAKGSTVKITIPCLLQLSDISRLAYALAVDKTPSRKVSMGTHEVYNLYSRARVPILVSCAEWVDRAALEGHFHCSCLQGAAQRNVTGAFQ